MYKEDKIIMYNEENNRLLKKKTELTLNEWKTRFKKESFEEPISLFFLSAWIFFISQFFTTALENANQELLFDKILCNWFEWNEEKLPKEIHFKVKIKVKILCEKYSILNIKFSCLLVRVETITFLGFFSASDSIWGIFETSSSPSESKIVIIISSSFFFKYFKPTEIAFWLPKLDLRLRILILFILLNEKKVGVRTVEQSFITKISAILFLLLISSLILASKRVRDSQSL